jgi:hypothetical protein
MSTTKSFDEGTAFEALVGQEPGTVTAAAVVLIVGLFFAVFGRKHHKQCFVLAAAFLGAWIGKYAMDQVSPMITDKIKDEAMVSYIVMAVCAVVLAMVVSKVQNIFYSAVGISLGLGLSQFVNEFFKTAIQADPMPSYAPTIVGVVGGVIGFFFFSKLVANAIGAIYAILGGVLIASSLSLFSLQVGGDAELWPSDLMVENADGVTVNLKNGELDLENAYLWLSIGIAVVFVAIGLFTGYKSASSKRGPSESSPLLGDPEQGGKSKAANKRR